MARTDYDSWDITESVGATALGVAMARAAESVCDCPLFTDRYAQIFVDAAIKRGWDSSAIATRLPIIKDYAAVRTKWFDEYFIAAGANGIDQTVILAAGLDARAWRLPWVSGSAVFEIDQPQVLAFKADTLTARGARPNARYQAVPIDLRADWPKALLEAGFDPSTPTAWSAEGLLPYLSAAGQDLLFERIVKLSATGSRIAVEALSPSAFDPDYLERGRQYLRDAQGDNRTRYPRSLVHGGTHRPSAMADRTRLGCHRDRDVELDATLRPATGPHCEGPGTAQRLHRRTAEHRSALLLGELKLDHRGNRIHCLAQRRQPFGCTRRGQHGVTIGRPDRDARCQRVQPFSRIEDAVDVVAEHLSPARQWKIAGVRDALEQSDDPVFERFDSSAR